MGIVEKLYDWDEIGNRLKNGDMFFGRTKWAADLYWDHRIKLKKEWADVNSYCKHRMLGYPYSTMTVNEEADDGSVISVEKKYVKDDAECQGPRLVLTENEFPYAFSPEVSHKLVWSVDDISKEQYERYVNERFSQNDFDIMVFVNPVHLKSIKGVHHAHVLLRRKRL